MHQDVLVFEFAMPSLLAVNILNRIDLIMANLPTKSLTRYLAYETARAVYLLTESVRSCCNACKIAICTVMVLETIVVNTTVAARNAFLGHYNRIRRFSQTMQQNSMLSACNKGVVHAVRSIFNDVFDPKELKKWINK